MKFWGFFGSGILAINSFKRERGMDLGMDFGLRFGKSNRTEVRSCFGCSKPNRYWGIPKTFFFFGRTMISPQVLRDEHPDRVGKRWRTVKRWRQNPPVTCRCSRLAVLSLRARQTLRLLKLGIPRSVTVLVRTCPRTY